MSALAFDQQKIKRINFECNLHDGIELACALHCLTDSVSFSPSLPPLLLSFSLPILPRVFLSLLTLCQLCFCPSFFLTFLFTHFFHLPLHPVFSWVTIYALIVCPPQ